MNYLETLGRFAESLIYLLGFIALFCGAALAGTAMVYGTILVFRAMSRWWLYRGWRSHTYSRPHYDPDVDWVILPREWFERLLPSDLSQAWYGILNQFQHQPWPPKGKRPVVRLIDEKGRMCAATPPGIYK